MKIDETSPDATLGERTLVQVTLLPANNNEGNLGPEPEGPLESDRGWT